AVPPAAGAPGRRRLRAPGHDHRQLPPRQHRVHVPQHALSRSHVHALPGHGDRDRAQALRPRPGKVRRGAVDGVLRRGSGQTGGPAVTCNDPIRLVHITTVPQTLNFLRGQVAYMKSRGIEVSAVSSPGPELQKFSDQEGVPVHAVEMPRRITPLGDLLALVRLVRLFRKLRPHVVHAHTPKGGLLGMIAAWIVGVPARIYTIHGLPLETAAGLKRTLLRWTERVSCALARRVTAVSESLRRRAAAEGVCRAERIVVLGAGTVNGVDAQRRFVPSPCPYEAAVARRACSIPSEVRVLGFVGRLVRDKGVEDLAAAWTELRETFPDLH